MLFERANSRGIFTAWDGVKTLTEVCGFFDDSCLPLLKRTWKVLVLFWSITAAQPRAKFN
jgi:hypothetical protein